ncbi:MAG: hypothetical protein LBD42_05190 [Desulfovibrio sp.]|jgi:2-beta-glucuronyltransferase|nr:hypothetical protein [Desulfovibrio sp.]
MMPVRSVITFVTGHYYPSKRRGGFHNLADAAHRAGHRVNFVTTGFSLISYLRRDYRTRIPGIRANLNRALEIRPGFVSYVHFTSWHPHTLVLPPLDRLTAPFMEAYGERDLGGLLPLVKETDVFVFESMSGLFLYKRFKRENPAARMIYRVSDDVRLLGSTHPRLVKLEREISPLFDLVSVPTETMLDIFSGVPNLRLHRHGLDKSVYDACRRSPYPEYGRNAVFVGVAYFDAESVRRMALGCPEWRFHIIGPIRDTLALPNARFYGEMPFAETPPYVKFADTGLMSLRRKNEFSRSFSDSLKVLQYRYCGLPIVCPDFLDLRRNGVFYYRPGDADSCARAVREAGMSGRDPARAEGVRDWDETARDIVTEEGKPCFRS